MKKIFLLILVVMLSISMFACTSQGTGTQPDQIQPEDNNKATSIVYKNTDYGFNFTLPGSWEEYSIVNSEWEGIALTEEDNGQLSEKGPIISIRNPLWTEELPRQDIPIMIFTLEQWSSLQKEEYHIGAAPIDPMELGRNDRYIFALPARYNFAFLPGYEEVEEIINNNSFTVVN